MWSNKGLVHRPLLPTDHPSHPLPQVIVFNAPGAIFPALLQATEAPGTSPLPLLIKAELPALKAPFLIMTGSRRKESIHLPFLKLNIWALSVARI